MYPLCTRPLVCMLLGFELMHLPPNVALFALEDNQSSAKALEPLPYPVYWYSLGGLLGVGLRFLEPAAAPTCCGGYVVSNAEALDWLSSGASNLEGR